MKWCALPKAKEIRGPDVTVESEILKLRFPLSKHHIKQEFVNNPDQYANPLCPSESGIL